MPHTDLACILYHFVCKMYLQNVNVNFESVSVVSCICRYFLRQRSVLWKNTEKKDWIGKLWLCDDEPSICVLKINVSLMNLE